MKYLYLKEQSCAIIPILISINVALAGVGTFCTVNFILFYSIRYVLQHGCSNLLHTAHRIYQYKW